MTSPADHAEREALQDLLQSDGWRVLQRLVEENYSSERCLHAIDAAMSELAPGDSEVAVVTQIRATWKAAPAILDLPATRLRALQSAQAPPKVDPFALFRRKPSPA